MKNILIIALGAEERWRGNEADKEFDSCPDADSVCGVYHADVSRKGCMDRRCPILGSIDGQKLCRLEKDEMTKDEFEKLAIGIEIGYTDRNGKPIKIGDNIVYYKRCTCAIDEEDDIRTYPSWQIVGNGHMGYVYTGKILRRHHIVTFSFENGFTIVPNAYAYLNETDKQGNLRLIQVLEDGEEAPKITLKELQEG